MPFEETSYPSITHYSTHFTNYASLTHIIPVIDNNKFELDKSFILFFHNNTRSPLTSYYGTDADFKNFPSVINKAIERFDVKRQHSKALAAALKSPLLDLSVIENDSKKFLLNPISFIESSAAKFQHSRINKSFLQNSKFRNNPLLQPLLEIASSVEPIFDPLFIPSLVNAAVRPQLVEIQPVINALFQINYSKGEVILITLNAFTKASQIFEFLMSLSNIWHTEKFNNDLGRLLYDYKNLLNGTPVNSEACRDAYRDKYGELIYPSISTYIALLWNAMIVFPNDRIVITKSDVHRAYHRFRWTASGSLKLALLISPDVVAIPITGGFGSNGPPFIYDVMSRFLQQSHRDRLLIKDISLQIGDTFVDDFVMFSSKPFADIEIQDHEGLINDLLGQGAAHRFEQDTKLDVIGARFDSVHNTVGISLKGYLKLVYLFFGVIPIGVTNKDHFPINLFQCLAGLTSRYGFFIPLLRHTPSVFYKLLRGPTRRMLRFSTVSLHSVALWRHYLETAFHYSGILSTPCIDYYHNNRISYNPLLLQNTYSAYSDATLLIIGLYVPNKGFSQIFVKDFTSQSISIANLEFIAFILAFILANKLNPSEKHIHLYIDNQNAEAWSRGTIHNDSNLSNSMVFVNSILQSTLSPVQTRAYIKSEDNIHADAISRNHFVNSENLMEYCVTSQTLVFLKSLVNQPEFIPSVVLHRILTMLESGGFYHI